MVKEQSKPSTTKAMAALKAGMDPKTARKYRKAGQLPSELAKPHTWRTRPDPFAQDWAALEVMLREDADLEATLLMEHLLHEQPRRYQPGQVRTLQRRLERWRAQHGPERRVYFPQEHRPGEAGQTDFTSGNGLGVTIAGEAFAHLLCQFVLPYSNWRWVTVARSESLLALRRQVIGGGVVEQGWRRRSHRQSYRQLAEKAAGRSGASSARWGVLAPVRLCQLRAAVEIASIRRHHLAVVTHFLRL